MRRETWYVAAGVVVGVLLISRKGWTAVFASGIPEQYRGLVDFYAKKHNVRPELIAAIVQVESGWNPKAYRAEPKLNDGSRGLGQLLYQTAKAYGYVGPAEGLFHPAVNLDWTALIIRRLWDKYKNLPDLAAAYNAGSPRRDASGKYINQRYVDKIVSTYNKLRHP